MYTFYELQSLVVANQALTSEVRACTSAAGKLHVLSSVKSRKLIKRAADALLWLDCNAHKSASGCVYYCFTDGMYSSKQVQELHISEIADMLEALK